MADQFRTHGRTTGIIRSGIINITYAGATQTQSLSVAFPTPFPTAAVHVCLTPGDNRFIVSATSISGNGFVANAFYVLGNVLAGFVLPVYWIARCD